MIAGLRIVAFLLFAAFAVFAGLFLYFACRGNRRIKARSAFSWHGLMFAVGIVAAVLYGGSKPTIIFDDYIVNNGSYVTNDYVHVPFTVALANIPSTTPVGVWYRDLALSNETDWVEYLPRWTVAEYPRDLPLANATNYDWCVWLDFTTEPVHTNGVWELKGFTVPGGATFNNTKLNLKGAIE